MKKLVYYSFNEDYIDIFLISIKSLLKNINHEDTDILVITNEYCRNDINVRNLPVIFHITNQKSSFESAAMRFSIYQFEKILDYEKILYLDTDTIIIKHIDLVFDSMVEIEIYTNQGYLSELSHPSYTFGLTDQELNLIKFENRFGINSGIFGFHISKLELFKDLVNFIDENKYLNLKLYEQPFFGTFLLRNNPTYLQLGDPLNTPNSNKVIINNESLTNIYKEINSLVILHFAGNIGNYNYKKKIMNKYV